MRTSKILALATIVILGGGFAGAPEAQARDWPNPFKWMKKKMKGEKPAPPPPSAPPRPMNPPPSAPPAPTTPVRNDPPAPQGTPKDGPQNGAPGGPTPTLVKNDAPPASGDPKAPKGGPTGGAEPAATAHVHVFRAGREEVVEPARYERVPAGRDKYGAPRFENRLVAPERRVLKDVQKCACGAIK